MRLRAATALDHELLTVLLAEAVNWAGQVRLPRAQIMAQVRASNYVSGWKRPTDFGAVALTDDDEPVGAIWARLFPQDAPGYGFIAEDVPELGMGVLPGWRGFGVGGLLLAAGIGQAQVLGWSAVSLSVDCANLTAHRLYEKHEFTVVGRNGNSHTMLLEV